MSALTALSSKTSQRDLARLILNNRAAKGRTEPFGVDRMRFRQIEALVRLLGAGAGDELAAAEVARLDATSTLVCAIADASRATLFAIQDPLLATRTFATVPTPGLRDLTVEDVVEIFDYDRLGDSAAVLASVLLGSASVHDRYDDLRLGMRMVGLCLDGRLVDSNVTLGLIATAAQALLTVGCVSSLDIATRIEQLRLFSRVLPATGAQYIDPDFQALAEEIADIDADRFVVETVQPQREDVIKRLQSAFRASRHWAYLDDLIAYCEGPRTDETPAQKGDRLGDFAVFQSWRAILRHSLADHDASIAVLGEASLPPRLSAFAEIARRAFRTNRTPYLGFTGLPLYEEGGDSDSPDVTDDKFDAAPAPATGFLGEAIEAIRLRIRRDDAGLDHKESLLRAMAAAQAGENEFAHDDFLAREAHAYGMIAYALYNADETPELGESGLPGLAAIIGEPRAWGTSYECALDAAVTLVTERSDAFPALRGALARASAIAHVLEDRDPHRAYAIYQSELFAIVQNSDLLANQTTASDAILLATDLVRSVGRIALMHNDRRSSSRLLAQAAFGIRELALALCRFCDSETVVGLAEMASGVAVGARLSDVGEQTTESLEAFKTRAAPAHNTPSVMIVCGQSTIIVLARSQGGPWEMTHAGTSAGAHMLGFAAEDMGSQLTTLMDFTEQLQDFLGHLWSGAAALATSNGGSVLYLPGGPPLLFASALLRAGASGLVSTPPVVIGSLSQRHANRVDAAVSVPIRVAALIGRDSVNTTGQADTARDKTVIGATGCMVKEVLGATLAEGLSEATCIHYSGHLASTGPDETVLALVDGDIAIGSIRTMKLAHIELAVLMACDTSRAPMGYSAEQCEHAAGAFLEAGVGAVVGALWPVFDRPALIFTRVFYEELAHGRPLGRAFDRAVDGVREHRVGQLVPYAHPVYWGAFTLFIGPGA